MWFHRVQESYDAELCGPVIPSVGQVWPAADWHEREAFDVRRADDAEVAAIKMLLKRYQDVRIDLADACLIRMTEIHADSVVMTLDSEFRDVFRRRGRQAIPTVMPPDRRRRAPTRR